MIRAAAKAFEKHAIKSQRIFIIPTKTGILYIGVNFTLFLMGLIYANNLVLLLAFCLFAALLLIMFQTHAILERLEARTIRIVDAPQGDSPGLRTPEGSAFLKFDLASDKGVLPAEAEILRGRYRLRHLKAWSTGEHDFFKVWTYRPMEETLFVYPKPIPSPLSQSFSKEPRAGGSEEFQKHRSYGQGEMGMRIDWKAYARTEELLVKQFEEEIPEGLLIKQESIAGDTEQQMSTIAFLINEALKAGLSWEIQGRSFSVPMGKGYPHWRKSMEALSEG